MATKQRDRRFRREQEIARQKKAGQKPKSKTEAYNRNRRNAEKASLRNMMP